MSKPSNDVLLEKIENLSEKIERGFQGVHERQDKTNGNVIRNTEHRLKVESNLSTFKWLFGFLGVGNIILFLKVVLGVI
jgi:hypothetical protein